MRLLGGCGLGEAFLSYFILHGISQRSFLNKLTGINIQF